MRKLCFALVMMLVSTLAFANSTVNNIRVDNCDALISVNNLDMNISYNLSFETNELFTSCTITFNFVNAEGELEFTATYNFTLSNSGDSCSDAVGQFRKRAILAYYDHVG